MHIVMDTMVALPPVTCDTMMAILFETLKFPPNFCRTCLGVLKMTTQPQWSSRCLTWTCLMLGRLLARICWRMLALATAWGCRTCTFTNSPSHMNSMLHHPLPDFETLVLYNSPPCLSCIHLSSFDASQTPGTHYMKLELTRLEPHIVCCAVLNCWWATACLLISFIFTK